ncbi:uncharacterized protein N7479_009576 [Penicillium vulpinum]|uniref:Uncharacterized protein n=1 Tax=Penicillium vulpinum TaxID=29845 RepID=A0A1V6RYK2_9EURO|nr:uncharacterized protein N7479_009576 [Penicillium vulpinum]KAJ5951163.1 hypothetical protein N7479_009576 [Penicillium vulpinum]OQE06857.1 hypothetical protein PENVUL_c016G08811 [Penicillium vulpinum]
MDDFQIEDFEVRGELDITGSVPKLEGAVNWQDWEVSLKIALGANNRFYVHIISHGIERPLPPPYRENSTDAIRSLLQQEGITEINSTAIRERGIQVVEENKLLRKAYNDKCSKWVTCNSRAFLQMKKTLGVNASSSVAQMTGVREAYLKLRKTYFTIPHQQSYVRFTKFNDMRYEGGAASEFVRKFQGALRDLNQMAGDLSPILELCHFKKAIVDNPRCLPFMQNLKIDERDGHFIDKVYAEFKYTLDLNPA